MIITLHVLIALSGIACATYGYIRPTNKSLYASYGLIAMTFISGFILVLAEPAQMLRTCLSGIAYLAVVTAAVVLTRRKMSLAEMQAEQA